MAYTLQLDRLREAHQVAAFAHAVHGADMEPFHVWQERFDEWLELGTKVEPVDDLKEALGLCG